ncbi:MAG: tetratricopeptide repeat protein, partial [Phormidium sp.]
VYTLLGTLYQTKAENNQAEQYFRKALYLNPNYYEALIQLALLKEHRGDIAGANILQQRIQKLQQTGNRE